MMHGHTNVKFEIDLSPPLSAEVKNEWGEGNPTPPIRLHGMNREKFNFLNFSCRLLFLLGIIMMELKFVLFFVVN